ICEAARRYGSVPLAELVRPAATLAREGVELNIQQAYVFEILADIVTATPEAAALFAPDGHVLGVGEQVRQPELADSLERLAAHALASLDQDPAPPDVRRIVAVMERTQAVRTPEFLEGLDDPQFVERFLARRAPAPPLGSTTHISVLDAQGWACSVTCSNGSCSGIVVPGTGVHLNNMLGEQDLNPLGFHRHPPGRRLPSMM